MKMKHIKRIILLILILFIIALKFQVITMNDLPIINDIQESNHQADTSTWNLILVNKDHYIPKNYSIKLKTLKNGKQVDERIVQPLQKMFDDARSQHLQLFVREGYRSEEQQKEIMQEYIKRYEKQGHNCFVSRKQARKYVALPRTSEHELGLSVDINADTNVCSKEEVYNWLNQNAYRYGFIKRYPKDKVDITGINNEPWHYRYVGIEAATEMKEKNLCLEEYLKSR